MAVDSFSAQVSAFVTKTKERQRAVFLESVQRTLEEAQKVGPSVTNPGGGEGGHMPVRTGFLRASLQVTLGVEIPPAVRKPEGSAAYAYDGGVISVSIAKATVQDTITASWTASYAVYVESRYAFVRLALQQWPQIVAKVCADLEARVGS